MNWICLELCLLLPLYGNSQITYDKGYLIDSLGQKKTCYILNLGWQKNPTSFVYRLDETGESFSGDLYNTKEFGVEKDWAFMAASIEIDRSSDNPENYSHQKEPEWTTERVFLRRVIWGDACLYSFEDAYIKRYYLSLNSEAPVALVHKLYIAGIDEYVYAENDQFRQQLWQMVRCSSSSMKKFSQLPYSLRALSRIVTEFNQCNGQPSGIPEARKRQRLVHLSLKTGLMYSKCRISEYSKYDINVEFNPQLTPYLGVGMEAVFPFYRNKLSLVFEPGLGRYYSTKEIDGDAFNIRHNYLDLPIGLQYTLFLKRGYCVYAEGYYVPMLGFRFESNFIINNWLKYELANAPDIILGAGVIKGRWSFSARYYFPISLTNKMFFWESSFKRNSIVLGWRIF